MSLNHALDITMELPLDEREMLVAIISKRIVEERRQEIAEYSEFIKEEYRKGNLKAITAVEAISELEKELG